jgi:hypothetical protein
MIAFRIPIKILIVDMKIKTRDAMPELALKSVILLMELESQPVAKGVETQLGNNDVMVMTFSACAVRLIQRLNCVFFRTQKMNNLQGEEYPVNGHVT